VAPAILLTGSPPLRHRSSTTLHVLDGFFTDRVLAVELSDFPEHTAQICSLEFQKQLRKQKRKKHKE
jgi:hypothetical protein